MNRDFDMRESLEELEAADWGEPTYDSHLVTKVHRLRRKPLAEFTVEDLRIMIGQKVGLAFLVPLAIERLELEPLVAGDYYPGDLLQSVLRINRAFWVDHPSCFERVRQVVCQVRELIPSLEEVDRATIQDVLAVGRKSLLE